MTDSYDNDEFRGGQALSCRRLRVTADSNQIEFAGGAIINWNPTGARTLTLPDSDIDMADIGDLALPATTTVLGGVIVPTSGRLLVDGSGNLSVDTTKVAALGVTNSFTKGQTFAAVAATYAATISLDPTAANVFRVTTVHATSATSTLNLASSPPAGQQITVICSANNNSDVITFGTHFKSTGTVTPGSGTFIVVEFVSNGTDALEISRTASAL